MSAKDPEKFSTKKMVSIYCVASPLHYLCASQIREHHDTCERQIILYYRSGLTSLIDIKIWKEIIYAPWPRFEPLPGLFGKQRRLISNIKNLAALVGQVDEVHFHSPVFDTEAINYYLHGLRVLCGNPDIKARILPDGVMNLSSRPMPLSKRLGQYLRKLRRLTSPLLNYWCFSGDRIGSDASFVDRIYTLPDLPSPYAKHKVHPIRLWDNPSGLQQKGRASKVLIVGQPLCGIGLLDARQVRQISMMIADWLKAQGVQEVYYKPHPRDPEHEFQVAGSQVLEITVPLEQHLLQAPYSAIVGVDSTTLLLAKQMFGARIPVHSFGMNLLKNATSESLVQLRQIMKNTGIVMHDAPSSPLTH